MEESVKIGIGGVIEELTVEAAEKEMRDLLQRGKALANALSRHALGVGNRQQGRQLDQVWRELAEAQRYLPAAS